MSSQDSQKHEGPLSVLFIDNFDSFTFNLVDEFEKRRCNVQVWRNNTSAADLLRLALQLPAPRLVAISPGPSAPKDAGSCLEFVQMASKQVPIFGVCLGHQVIVEAFGGTVGSAGEIVHGKATTIVHDAKGIFQDLPSPLSVGRYHSLVGLEIPQELRVTARTGEMVMAVEHTIAPVLGIQFHPESILTPLGGRLFENVIRWAHAKSS